jgi:uncharacterized cupredoxin-like copper-binding protein
MRRVFWIPILAATLVATLGLARLAAAQSPTQVAITLTEYKLSMDSTTVSAGVPLTFSATNDGTMMHEVVLEPAGAVDQPFEMNGRQTEIEHIAPGETKSATWTITQPGEYQLACHLPGHFEAGMVERFTVAAAPGAGQWVVRTQPSPMQVAAPAAEDQAEGEGQSTLAAMIMTSGSPPHTLPVTGNSMGASALFWVVAIAGVCAAIFGAFRLILWQVKIER